MDIATLEGPSGRQISRRHGLRLVSSTSGPEIRSLFSPFATTHPSMPKVHQPNLEQLYGSILEPTTTTRLRAVIGSIADTYPPIQTVNVARTITDFKKFLLRTTTVDGVQIKFSDHIDNPQITYDFLSFRADQPRYCAVARAMIKIIDIDYERDSKTQAVIGPEQLLRLGNLALFAVDQDEYASGYKQILRDRLVDT